MGSNASDELAANQQELTERIGRLVPSDGAIMPIPGVRLRRMSEPTEAGHGVSFPCFCQIAQGRKELRLGDQRFFYDADHYLVATTALPIASRVVEASPERPYLGCILLLDPIMVGSVMVEVGHPTPSQGAEPTAVATSPTEPELLDAVLRLVRLVERPADARFLGPLIQREIVYRLLMGPQGDRIRQISTLAGDRNRMAEAIARLRNDYDKPLRMDTLAQELGMSVSGLHHQFKQVTAMSPLQFQKQLRLQEARRLLLSGEFDAASAGHRVGYDDASHFSRDYKRLFGNPPVRDVDRLRSAPVEVALA